MKKQNQYDFDAADKAITRLGFWILGIAIVMLATFAIVIVMTTNVHAQAKNDFPLPTQRQVEAARKTMVMPSDQAFQDHMKKRGNSDSEA